jgi:hypothetical protein
MSTVRTTWPPYPTLHSRSQNLEPLENEVVRNPAANLTLIEGHINGAERVGNIANPAPLNPSGDRGHDHSGGDFGTPLFRSIATVNVDGGETYSSNIAGTTYPNTLCLFQYFSPATLEPGKEGAISSTSHLFHPWVPPCPPETGAYQNLSVCAVMTSDGALGASDLVWLRITNQHRLLRKPAGDYPFMRLAISSPGASGVRTDSSGSAERLLTVPGSINPLKCELEVTLDGGGSARAPYFQLLHLELGVYG